MTVSSLPGILTPLFPLLTTTGIGIGVAVPIGNNHCMVIIRGAGTISAGTIVIEESDDPAYTGDWSLIYTVDATDVTSDAQQVIHIASTLRALRLRVTSDLTGGGSVSADLVSN